MNLGMYLLVSNLTLITLVAFKNIYNTSLSTLKNCQQTRKVRDNQKTQNSLSKKKNKIKIKQI